MSRVEGVLFDVDDTLIDTKAAFVRAVGAVRARYLPHVPAAREPELVSHWRTDPGGFYRRYTRGEMDHLTQRRLRAELLHETFGGPPVTDATFPAWDDLFWTTFEGSWAAHPDARGAVDALVASGVRVGVVTNAAVDLQVRKLAASGLGDVPVLVGVDTLGYGKPAPEVFLEGARRLGTDPVRTAYVGDEPEVDARAARAAGLVGVWLDRPDHRRGAGYGGPGAAEDPQDPHALRADGVAVIASLTGLPGVLGL